MLSPDFAAQAGKMKELGAVVVGVLVASDSGGDRTLVLRDTSGDIPCEVSHRQQQNEHLVLLFRAGKLS